MGSFPSLRPLHAGPSLCGGQCFGHGGTPAHVARVGGVMRRPNFGLGLAVSGHGPQVIAWILHIGSRQDPVCGRSCAFDYVVLGGVSRISKRRVGFSRISRRRAGQAGPQDASQTGACSWCWGCPTLTRSASPGHQGGHPKGRQCKRAGTPLGLRCCLRLWAWSAQAPPFRSIGPAPNDLGWRFVEPHPTGGLGVYVLGSL